MFSTAEYSQHPKLIVLIPERLAGNLELSRSVAHCAEGRVQEVVYLVSLQDLNTTLQVIRSMVTMKAMTSGRHLVVSYQMAGNASILRTLRHLCAAQDITTIPQPSADQPGKFKLVPVRSCDWFSLTAAFISAANKPSGSLF